MIALYAFQIASLLLLLLLFIMEDRLRMLKTILASPNSNAIHINRAVNRDFLFAIGRCGPFYVAHYVGNPLPMLKERYT